MLGFDVLVARSARVSATLELSSGGKDGNCIALRNNLGSRPSLAEAKPNSESNARARPATRVGRAAAAILARRAKNAILMRYVD